MLPDVVRHLIFEYVCSMELYDRKKMMHCELKFRVVTFWIRNNINKDLRYARFLLLI